MRKQDLKILGSMLLGTTTLTALVVTGLWNAGLL